MAARGPSDAFQEAGSKVRVTEMKAIGVSLTPSSDSPYVFVKLETNAGLVAWGEATLEGKAGATIACVNDATADLHTPFCVSNSKLE